MEISRFNLKWKGYLLQLMLLGVFSQIYPNSMESRLAPTLHAVPIESRSNSKKIYCFVPHLLQTYESDHFRNLFCRWPLFRFTATQDRPNLWGNTFLVEERQARYCLYYLFVRNIIFPRQPNLWRIIFLVEEILCLWINPSIIFLWGSITSPQILKYYFCGQEIQHSINFLFSHATPLIFMEGWKFTISLYTEPPTKI